MIPWPRLDYAYSTGDHTYGAWIIFQRGVPKFYYIAFNESGLNDPIAEYAASEHTDVGTVLIHVLRSIGFPDCKAHDRCFFQLKSGSELVDVNVLRVIGKTKGGD